MFPINPRVKKIIFQDRFGKKNARAKRYDENIEKQKVMTVKIVKITKVKNTTIIIIKLKNKLLLA
uniref:Putative ovule protein n=1 Tax=Solanum chacoense TaxID=4108 RepID=A0A0V0H055_SOLCH